MFRDKTAATSGTGFGSRPCVLIRAAGITLLLLFFSVLATPCPAAQTGDAGLPKLVILPFTMSTPASLGYLQSGIRDMLSSRLAWQSKVQVVDTPEAYKTAFAAKAIGQNEALRIAASLKADYILYGSITSAGQSVSIEAKMVPVSGKTEPVSFYVQTTTLDDILPQVNLFAQRINQKISGKPEEKPQAASAEAEALATRDPELLIPGAIASGDRIAYINPSFVEAASDPLKSPGYWQSRDFQGGILGMDLGDVDGDGKDEIVVMQTRKLTVYKKENQDLRTVATFEGTKADHFVWVSVADINREGKACIFLTNIRMKSASGSSPGEASRQLPARSDDVSSYVLSVSGGKVQVVAQGLPYFLNAVYLGQRGKVLIGQKQGEKREDTLSGAIYEMQLRSDSLTPGPAIDVPKDVNVFNFAKADLKNDKLEKIVMLDDDHKLRILSAAGGQLWKGDGRWGATTNVFQSKVDAIPSPILIADLRKSGAQEIVLNRNAASSHRWLSDALKYCGRGEIVSLSWDNKTLTENWKTREFNGEITSLRIGDLDGNGIKQLVISLVYAKDLLKVWDSTSVIVTYDLNVK
ncbi:MAG TPA: FG-GAP-like repeat-containing protein [Syntrophobacteraceae bacterium]|nr:FG-GAP-like repeat-containing protein [Syntrophobacteraceae bacterium]